MLIDKQTQLSDAQAGNRRLCIVDSGINGTHEDLAGIPMTGENFTKLVNLWLDSQHTPEWP